MSLIHTRQMEGVQSRQVLDWFGVPMRGLYFVENTLPGGPPETAVDNPAIVLFPGGFDPIDGGVSEDLIRAMLTEANAPYVMEAHYIHEDQAGYIDPPSVADDVKTLCLNTVQPAVLVALCGGAIMVLDGVMQAARDEAPHTLVGCLVIGPPLFKYFNKFGHIIQQGVFFSRNTPESKLYRFAGHPHVPGNVTRLHEWSRQSMLTATVDRWDPKQRTNDPFPIPVEAVYFRIDIMTRTGRTCLQRLFNCPPRKERIPGAHRALRYSAEGDAIVKSIYLEFIQRAGAARLETEAVSCP